MWAAIKARLRRSEEAPDESIAPNPLSTPGTAAGAASPAAPPDASVPPAPVGQGPEIFTEGFLGRRLKEGTIDDVLDDLEIVLLESDVAVPVIERLRRDLHKELAGQEAPIWRGRGRRDPRLP